MKKILLVSVFITLISCEKKIEEVQQKIKYPKLKVEKIIVFNNRENSLVYFKTYIANNNNKTIVFLDNSLEENYLKCQKFQKKGFYLKNISNDSLITLGIDNYYFYEVGAKKSGYCFLGAVNIKKSYNQKDSLLLRKMISNYTMEYNGKKLNLNKIEKSKYISQYDYDEFNRRKSNFIPFRYNLSVSIPKNIIIKYIDNMPTTKEGWDKL